MDQQINIEALRQALAGMSRQEADGVADRAHLSKSTVAKFRKGHIQEPRFSKLQALAAAIWPELSRPKQKKEGA